MLPDAVSTTARRQASAASAPSPRVTTAHNPFRESYYNAYVTADAEPPPRPSQHKDVERRSWASHPDDDPQLVAALAATYAELYPAESEELGRRLSGSGSLSRGGADDPRRDELAATRTQFEIIDARHACGLASGDELEAARRQFEDANADRAPLVQRLRIRAGVLQQALRLARAQRRDARRRAAQDDLRTRAATDLLPPLRQALAALTALEPVRAAAVDRINRHAGVSVVTRLAERLTTELGVLEQFCGSAAPAAPSQDVVVRRSRRSGVVG